MVDLEYDYGIESLFEDDYKDAQAYHKRALQFQNEDQAFSLVFNIASVALERYLVAICELYGIEPMNHNFITLAITVEKLIEMPQMLSKEIKSLDQIFGICFLENYHHGTPKETDTTRVLQMCDDVKRLFNQDRIRYVQAALKNINQSIQLD